MTRLAANNAATALAQPLAPGDTTVTVRAGGFESFPAPTPGNIFVATLSDATGLITEIVHVTLVSGDTAAIVRAQENTVALNWPAGSLFQNLWTAGQATDKGGAFNQTLGLISIGF